MVTDFESSLRPAPTVQSDAEPGAFSIGTAADNLLLCAQYGAAHLKAIPLKVITESTLHGETEFIIQSQRIKKASANCLASRQSLCWRGTENFESQLSEFAITTGLRSFIPVTSRHIEKHRFLS